MSPTKPTLADFAGMALKVTKLLFLREIRSLAFKGWNVQRAVCSPMLRNQYQEAARLRRRMRKPPPDPPCGGALPAVTAANCLEGGVTEADDHRLLVHAHNFMGQLGHHLLLPAMSVEAVTAEDRLLVELQQLHRHIDSLVHGTIP